MKFFKTKGFVLLLTIIILVVLIVVSSNPQSPIHSVYTVVSVPITPVQNFFTNIGGWFSNTFYIIGNSSQLEEEYNKHKEENDRLREEIRALEKYKEENEELRELLDFREVYDDYNLIASNLVAHDVNNWYNAFSIDRGTADGVSLFDPVVTSKGLVGKIIDVSRNSAKVMAIIDETSTVMGRVTKTNDLARIRGASSTEFRGLCQMDRISELADISVGDLIETAESGGIYPKGVIIGKVKEINIVAGDNSRYAIIEPAVDFRRIDKVIVLSTPDTGNEVAENSDGDDS